MNKKDKKKEIENWDWKSNDREFYLKFYNLPEAQNKKYFDAIKEHRFNSMGKPTRVDLRPKIFLKKMKFEVIIFFFGLAFALSIY